MRRRSILGLVLVALAVGKVRAGDSKPVQRQIPIFSSPSFLPVGTLCEVQLQVEMHNEKKRLEVSYFGKVVKANDDGLSLLVTSKRNKIVHDTALSHVPVINRLFTNVGIGQSKPGEEKEVWIPVEKIREVRLVRSS